jgi:hypothetical protein
MKTSVPLVTALLCIFSLVNFTATAGKSVDNTLEIDLPSGEYTGCFIQFADGSIQKYATLKLVTGVFKTPHLLANDSIVIYASQVRAYQNEQCFAVSQKEFGESKKTFVAKEALPGFAVRVVKGRLNVFSIKYYNGHNTTEKLFIQNGDRGAITACTHELLEQLVKDNSDAVTILHEKNKGINDTKKFLAAVETFNNQKLLSKN